MPTLTSLMAKLCGSDGTGGIIQDVAYYGTLGADITARINAAVTSIAGGLRMPDGQFSPPMPGLFDTDTVTTSTSLPYVSLPSDYQRSVVLVADSNGNQIYGPKGGGYDAFRMFLRQSPDKALDQAGSISMVCVNGSRLYYQGIPSAAKTLTVHFYRTPEDMSEGADTPDGLPSHLSERLITHFVCKEIYSEIEDGDNSQGVGLKTQERKFWETMTDLMDFLPEDGEPEYYGTGEFQDLGVCD